MEESMDIRAYAFMFLYSSFCDSAKTQYMTKICYMDPNKCGELLYLRLNNFA